MKTHIASLIIFCLALAVMPAWAQWSYDNGPINGNTNAWIINLNYVVSDTFYAGGPTTGFAFGAWEYFGDSLTSVDWSITTGANGGTTIGSGTATTSGGKGGTLTDQFRSQNNYGFDIDLITVTGLNVSTTSGTTYWLNLFNATVPSGNPVYWDENSGTGCGGSGGGANCPSQAYELGVLGTIPSEAFSISGSNGTGTTPEPGSIMLFGSGVLGLAGLLRRKLL
jgi:PEP-CTERM motif